MLSAAHSFRDQEECLVERESAYQEEAQQEWRDFSKQMLVYVELSFKGYIWHMLDVATPPTTRALWIKVTTSTYLLSLLLPAIQFALIHATPS